MLTLLTHAKNNDFRLHLIDTPANVYTAQERLNVSNVKTEKGEGAVHLVIAENLYSLGIKKGRF